MTAWLPHCRAAARASASCISRSLEARVGESAERRPRLRWPARVARGSALRARGAGVGVNRAATIYAAEWRRGSGRAWSGASRARRQGPPA